MNPARGSKVPTRDLVKHLAQKVDQLEQLCKALFMEIEKLAQNANVSRMQVFARFSAFEKAGLIKLLGYEGDDADAKWAALQEECFQEKVQEYEAFIMAQMEKEAAAQKQAEAQDEKKNSPGPAIAEAGEQQAEDQEDEDEEDEEGEQAPPTDNVIVFKKK